MIPQMSGQSLSRAANILQEKAEEYAGYLTLEIGKRIAESHAEVALSAAIRSVLEQPVDGSSLFIDDIAPALEAHFLGTNATTLIEGRSVRGALASWQERRAKEAMNASLDKDISIAQLARKRGID
jgi:hypothetical protein